MKKVGIEVELFYEHSIPIKHYVKESNSNVKKVVFL